MKLADRLFNKLLPLVSERFVVVAWSFHERLVLVALVPELEGEELLPSVPVAEPSVAALVPVVLVERLPQVAVAPDLVLGHHNPVMVRV